MSTNNYTVGTLVRVSTVVTQIVGGSPIDPTTITLTLELPDGTIVDLTSAIVRDSTGNYHADYTPVAFGLHQYEWAGTGAAQVAKVGSFIVNQGPL